jgi:hypothetical protein
MVACERTERKKEEGEGNKGRKEGGRKQRRGSVVKVSYSLWIQTSKLVITGILSIVQKLRSHPNYLARKFPH